MVLEHLFPEDWLEKKARFAFLIAVIYSTIGIIVSRVLFGANSGIVSVFFVSLFLLPYLKRLFDKERHLEEKEKSGSIIEIIRNHLPAIKVYLCIFLGVYLTYMIYAFSMPLLGYNPSLFFGEQLMLNGSVKGNAFSIGTFASILAYNWWVLLACFILALIVGDGAAFFIIWNASSWGVLMGYRAVTGALYADANPLWFLLLVFVITFAHLILEGLSYIIAAISGSIISENVISKSKKIKQFVLYLFAASILFWVFYMLYTNIIGYAGLLFTLASIALIAALIYRMNDLFSDKMHCKIFKYNYKLFLIAILILLFAAIVETIVLSNSTTLRVIYRLSMMF